MENAAIPPVRKLIRVALPAARAFTLFTADMHRWWPRAHSLNPTVERAAIVVEPRPGGQWLERAVDGTECKWGRVLQWEPPRRVLFAWHLDANWQFTDAFFTEVEIIFEPTSEQTTLVKLEHRNLERYGDQAAKVRTGLDSPEGWEGGLKLYAVAAANP